MALITVAMITRNQGSYLFQALDSLKHQSLSHDRYEVVVVDDRSTDDTSGILDECSRDWPELKTVTLEGKGIADGCNQILGKANGKYFLRFDSDDIACPSLLSSLLMGMDGVDVCFSDYFLLSKEGEFSVTSINVENLYELHACGVMYRTSRLRELGGYNSVFWEEHDLHIRLKQAGVRFYHIALPLWIYRRHDDNISSRWDLRVQGWKELTSMHGSDVVLGYGSAHEMRH